VFVAAFQTEGKLYLILEFLRGGDLFTRLSKEVCHQLKSSLTDNVLVCDGCKCVCFMTHVYLISRTNNRVLKL